jgi:hypothetical protein
MFQFPRLTVEHSRTETASEAAAAAPARNLFGTCPSETTDCGLVETSPAETPITPPFARNPDEVHSRLSTSECNDHAHHILMLNSQPTGNSPSIPISVVRADSVEWGRPNGGPICPQTLMCDPLLTCAQHLRLAADHLAAAGRPEEAARIRLECDREELSALREQADRKFTELQSLNEQITAIQKRLGRHATRVDREFEPEARPIGRSDSPNAVSDLSLILRAGGSNPEPDDATDSPAAEESEDTARGSTPTPPRTRETDNVEEDMDRDIQEGSASTRSHSRVRIRVQEVNRGKLRGAARRILHRAALPTSNGCLVHVVDQTLQSGPVENRSGTVVTSQDVAELVAPAVINTAGAELNLSHRSGRISGNLLPGLSRPTQMVRLVVTRLGADNDAIAELTFPEGTILAGRSEPPPRSVRVVAMQPVSMLVSCENRLYVVTLDLPTTQARSPVSEAAVKTVTGTKPDLRSVRGKPLDVCEDAAPIGQPVSTSDAPPAAPPVDDSLPDPPQPVPTRTE